MKLAKAAQLCLFEIHDKVECDTCDSELQGFLPRSKIFSKTSVIAHGLPLAGWHSSIPMAGPSTDLAHPY